MWTTLFGHWLTPYTLEPVQSLLVIWLLVRWVRLRDDRLLLALGAVTGIALLTKFQALLLCVVLAIVVAAVGPRELLRRPMLWTGAGVAAALAAPTLVWQQLHGWPQLLMAPVVAGEAEALYGGRHGIAVQMIVFAGVAGAALVLYGRWRLLRDDELRNYRFIGAAFVVLYVVFVATAGRPYYIAGLYAPLAAAGALGLQRRRETGPSRRRWLIWPGYVLRGAGRRHSDPVGDDRPLRCRRADRATHRGCLPRAAAGAARPHGAVRRVLHRRRVSRRLLQALPVARGVQTNRSYGYFPPPPADHDTVLYVGRDPDALRSRFADVRTVGDIGEDMHAYLLTGQRQSWDEMWPQLRTLTVS